MGPRQQAHCVRRRRPGRLWPFLGAQRWSRGGAAPAGSPQNALTWSFSPQGKTLAYTLNHPERQADIWTLPLDMSDPEHPKRGEPELFLGTQALESAPQFSPDG